MAKTGVGWGLPSLLASLVLTAAIILPKVSERILLHNITYILLVLGFFFGLSILVEAAVRNMLRPQEAKAHPTVAILLVLMSSTLMLFFFLGLAFA